MLPRKTGPAPIFNYRKRPRQAVVADPESQTTKVLSQGGQDPSSHRTPQQSATFANASTTSYWGGRGITAPAASNGPIPPHPAARRPPVPAALPGKPVAVDGNWRGTGTLPGQNAMMPNKDWKAGSLPIRQPAPAAAGHSGNARRQQQQQQQQQLQQSLYQPSRAMVPPCGRRSVSSLQQNVVLPKAKSVDMGGSVIETKKSTSSDQSLRVLTLPVAHMKRALGLLHDRSSMPPFLFCVFGIVDSATVFDSRFSGKSFTLRDETGRIMCVFCEIDRQMPRLHRGQWYRIVAVARLWWQGLQCLSLRPVGMEERQAARAVTSLSVAQLNDLCLSAAEL